MMKWTESSSSSSSSSSFLTLLHRRGVDQIVVLYPRRSLPMITESLLLLYSSPLCLDTLANGNTLAANLMSIVLLYKYSGSRQGPSPRFSSEQYNVRPDTSYRIVSVAEEESPSLSPKEPSPSERCHQRIVFCRRRSREEFSVDDTESSFTEGDSLNCLHHGCISVSYL